MSVLYDFNLILLGGKNKKRPGLIITKETTNFGGRENLEKNHNKIFHNSNNDLL